MGRCEKFENKNNCDNIIGNYEEIFWNFDTILGKTSKKSGEIF